MKNRKSVLWWIFIGWWWMPTYYLLIWWWLKPIQNILNKKKNTSSDLIPVPSFIVVSWDDHLENIKKWQKTYARDNWANAKFNNKPLYHYSWERSNVCFLAEPDNRHDNKAIAVYLDDLHIGYVPREINARYHDQILRTHSSVAEIHGGDCKYIGSNGDLIIEKRKPIVEVRY